MRCQIYRWGMLAALLAIGTGVEAREEQGPAVLSHEAGQATGSEEASGSALMTPGVKAAAQDRAGGESSEPMRVSMEFQDANLKDVLKTFSQQTGINVIAGGDLGDQAITLYLEDVSVMDALDQILHAAKLTYERSPGSDIYIVKPKGAETEIAKTITRVYQLKYGRVSKSVLAKVAAAFGQKTPFEGKIATTGAGESSGGAASGGGGSGGGDVGIDIVLRELLTHDVGKVVVDGRTNRLILTDVPENFPRLEAALAALDIRTAQILVDAEVIETDLNKLKELGIEWGSTADSGKTLFTMTPGSRSSRFPFGVFRNDISATDQGHFSATTIDASSFKGVLKALETDVDTKILARPKVLTLDNESALIRLTTEEAIGLQTTTGQITSTTSVTAERSTTGIVLVVTPQVNDNDFITMMVEPSVAKTVESNISASIRDPKSRSVRTLVRIRSGDTLVVGGLIDRSDESSLRQVPVLSGIPFVGEAFKKKGVKGTASELIVFVTPSLLKEPSAQVALSGQSPLGLREQEPSGVRQDVMEKALNTLEREQRL